MKKTEDSEQLALEQTAAATPTPTPKGQRPVTPSAQSASETPLELGQILGDRYQILRLLGKGGMGAVYLARDEVLGKEVALKIVDREHGPAYDLKLLREEVRLAHQVTHRNVCRTYDLEQIGVEWFLKMEYVAGVTLDAHAAATGGTLPFTAVSEIGQQIAHGLGAAHAHGIVHRDLKPQNVMIEEGTRRVLLMDFGIARADVEAGSTAEGIAGTPYYMAPEQARGRHVDARADLYALGCVLYFMVTGKPVFPAANAMAAALRQVEDAPPDPRVTRPDTPLWLAAIIARLLEKDPARRFQDAAVVAEALAAQGVRPGSKRGPLLMLGAGAAIVAAVVIVVAVRHGHQEPAWHPLVEPVEPQFVEQGGEAALSPDGTRIAYTSDRENPEGPPRVYVMDAHGSSDGGKAITPSDMFPHSVRWTRDGSALLFGSQENIFRQPWTGGTPEDLGPGYLADDCGDGIAIVTFRFDDSALELRAADGTRTLLHDLGTPMYSFPSYPRCDPSGQHVVVTLGFSYPWACANDIWLFDRHGGAQALTTDHTTCRATFAADGRSILFSAKRNREIQLYEMPAGGGPAHQLTEESGPNTNADVSRDGKVLLFEHEVNTSTLKVGEGASVTTLPIRIGAVDSVNATRDLAHVIVVRDDPGGGLIVETIGLADRHEHVLAAGTLAFASFDGTRVYYRSLDHGDELRVVSIEGGPSEVVARLPGQIAMGASGPDGAHVMISMGDHKFGGWRVTNDGKVEDEGSPGMVIPAPTGGWRAIQIPDDSFRLQLVPPGAPISAPARELVIDSIYNFWIDDHRITAERDGKFQIIDATTGTTSDVPATADLWPVSLLSADGKRWVTVDRNRSPSRRLLTNFASRPWR